MQWWGWLLIGIGVLLIAAIVFLYIYGRKMQKKQTEAEQQMEAMKQTVSLLVIDKKKKKLKEAGLPEQVYNETPWYAKRVKVPVVKCKIGPRIMTLIAEESVFQILPVNKTCTVTVSGIYITELKAVRGGSVPKAPVKRNIFQKAGDKIKGFFKKKDQEPAKKDTKKK